MPLLSLFPCQCLVQACILNFGTFGTGDRMFPQTLSVLAFEQQPLKAQGGALQASAIVIGVSQSGGTHVT